MCSSFAPQKLLFSGGFSEFGSNRTPCASLQILCARWWGRESCPHCAVLVGYVTLRGCVRGRTWRNSQTGPLLSRGSQVPQPFVGLGFSTGEPRAPVVVFPLCTFHRCGEIRIGRHYGLQTAVKGTAKRISRAYSLHLLCIRVLYLCFRRSRFAGRTELHTENNAENGEKWGWRFDASMNVYYRAAKFAFLMT